MKRIVVAFLAFFSLCAYPQNCGNTVRVLTVFSSAAVAKLQAAPHNMTMAQFVDTRVIAETNSTFQGSGLATRVESAGIRSGPSVCCGPVPFLSSLATPGVTALIWVADNIQLAQERDAANADIVLVITDFAIGNANANPPYGDAYGVSIRRGPPGQSLKCKNGFVLQARDGYVGVNLGAVFGNQFTIAHEIGHQLCMEDNDEGVDRMVGVSPSNCNVWWTIEVSAYTDGQMEVSCSGYDRHLEQHSSGHVCTQPDWCNDFAMKRITDPNYTAAWSPPAFGDVLPVGGGTYCQAMAVRKSTSQYDAFTAANFPPLHSGQSYFTCPAWTGKIPYFSNPNVTFGGVATGDSTHNSAAAIAAQTPKTSCFRNTKLAPGLRAAAFGAAMQQQ